MKVDLLRLIQATAQGGLLTLDSGTLYEMPVQGLLRNAITINGNGATVIAPAVHDCFTFLKPGITIRGLKCSKANIFAHIQAANCRLEACDLSNVTNAVKCERGLGFVARNVKATSNSVTYYTDCGFILIDCSGFSYGEYAVRTEGGLTLVQGGTYTNCGNIHPHDTIGNRMGRMRLTGAVIEGNIRSGQGNKNPDVVKPGDFATMEIDNCTFCKLSKGHNFIEVLFGADVYEHENAFDCPDKLRYVNSGGRLTHAAPTPPTVIP